MIRKIMVVVAGLMLLSVSNVRAEMCSADCNCDGQVNLTDLVKMKQEYFRSDCDPVCLPGVVGGVPKTGQTLCYDTVGIQRNCNGTGEDGEYQKGMVAPNQRFIDHGNGTVTDTFTGLMWTKNAQQIPGTMTWQAGLDACEILEFAECDDWRLPNIRELTSLIDYAQFYPALPSGHPFTNVEPFYYWSSSTVAGDLFNAWTIYSFYGSVDRSNKSADGYYVWPVRGGQ